MAKEASLIIRLKDMASEALAKLGSNFQKFSANLERSKYVFGAVAAGLGLIGKAALQASGKMQEWRIAFSTMLGSADRADILLNKIQNFAAKTPFDLPQVTQGAKGLLAFGVEANKIIPTLKSLGDVSAGLGVPMDRLILNFGQVRTQGKLTGMELRDFARAGVPIIAELAKNLGVAQDEIQKMTSAGKIKFADVEKAFTTMTKEGGRFFDLMEAQSRTLPGRLSNIGDSFFRIKTIIGDALMPIVMPLVIRFQSLLDIITTLSTKTKMWIIGISAAVGALSGFLAIGGVLVASWGAIVAAAGVLGTVFASLFTVIIPIIAIIGGVSLVVMALKDDFITLGNFVMDVFQSIKSWMAEALGYIIEKMTVFTEWLSAVLPDTVVESFEKMKGAVADFADENLTGFKKIYDKGKSSYTSLSTFVKGKIDEIKKALDKHNKDILSDAQLTDNAVGLSAKELMALKAKLYKENVEKFGKMMGNVQSMTSIVAGQITDIFGKESKAAFLANQAAAIASAIVNTARGITLALGTIPPPASFAVAGVIGALGAAQVGVISGQTVQGFAEGGIVMPQADGAIARVAEAGKPEAVIPLDDERAGEMLGGLGGLTININAGTIIADDLSVTEFAERIDAELFALSRNRKSVAL